MHSTHVEQQVRDVMPSPREHVEVYASPAFELLVALFALGGDRPPAAPSWLPSLSECSAALRRDVGRVGEHAGELWLHLLGLALELHAPTAREFVDRLGDVDPLELRRHVVGLHVPAWRRVAGVETLERAARGDSVSASELLANERYYAGRARESLERLLSLTPAQTKRTLLAVLRRFLDEVFSSHEEAVVAQLRDDAAAKTQLQRSLSREALIAAATNGYVYEPEPEFDRVVLAPHVSARPWLLLCQHRDARIICYPAGAESKTADEDVAERVLRLGVALADERRVQIVRRLAAGEATLAELAETAGLAKSTAHHHLAHLRAAGLVTLRGNARGYWYCLRLEALPEARELLGALLTAPQRGA
jgi:DNA-binding transcriptional ArsR family regulator